MAAGRPGEIVVLSGGVGAARLLKGLVQVVPPTAVTAVVNVGDDLVLHGLHISPDLDTITYTLAGAIDGERGWGLSDESWQAMKMLGRYGGADWFGLGDRDLGTHLYRTQRLADGADLSEVTAEIAAAWGIEVTMLPVSHDEVRTMLCLPDEGDIEVSFQEYFVRRHHGVPVSDIRIAGAEVASPAPGVLEALHQASVRIIAPSNPMISIDPLLAVPGVRDAVAQGRTTTVAVSPIVAGAALKGPADRLLHELGHESTVVGVARLYAPLAGTLVIDELDRDLAEAVEAEGMACVVTPTIMSGPAEAAALARTVLDVVR